MLDLSITRLGTNNDGTQMYLEDTTEWESPEQRVQYALFTEVLLGRVSGDEVVTDIVETLEYYSYDVLHNGIEVTHNGYAVDNTPLSGYEEITHNVYPTTYNGEYLTYDKLPKYEQAIDNTKYTVGLVNDGYYKVNMVAVPNSLPILVGEYGVDLEGNLVVKTEDDYALATPSDLIADESFTDWVTLNTLVIARLSIYTNEQWLSYFKESQKYFNDAGHYPELYQMKRGVDYAKAALNSAQYVWEYDNYTGAQSIIENIEPLWAIK